MRGVLAGMAIVAMLAAVMGISNPFSSHQTGLTSPAVHAFAITPDDDDLEFVTRGLYVGTGGTLVCTFLGGEELTITGIGDGAVYPFRLTNIDSTGTTATGLIGLY